MAEVNKYSDKTLGELEQMFQDSKAKETTAEKQTANLNQASQAAYQQTQLENEQAQNKFARNAMANQMSALDAIRKSNASAIANGANAGLSAANQLSSILGLQETTSEEATKLANADIDAAAKLNTQLNENAVKGQQMADDLNVKLGANQAEIGKAMAEVEKAQAQTDTAKIGAESNKEATDKQIEANKNQLSSADREANLKHSIDALDSLTANWQGGNNYTYVTSYYDPFTEKFVELGEHNLAGEQMTKEELNEITGKLKSKIYAAYASGDAEELKKWNDRASKYIGSIQTAQDNCLAPGTLITMADGSFKRVEDIQDGDLVQVWDFVNGSINVSAVLFVEHGEAQLNKVMTLTFSDATQVRIIDDHGFFDLDLMKFVYIQHPSDANKYVGHSFLKSDGTGTYPVQLISIDVTEENISTHSPCTICDLCLFANGMLSMPGATESFTNYFKISPKTLKYSKRDMKQSFRKYGTCSYEGFEDILPEYYFKAFNGELLNIGIGKGITTKEDILKLINRYGQYLK